MYITATKLLLIISPFLIHFLMFCIIFQCASCRLGSFVLHVNGICMFRTSYFGTKYLHNLYSVAIFCVKTFMYNFTFCGLCTVILRNKDQQDALFFLNLFQ